MAGRKLVSTVNSMNINTRIPWAQLGEKLTHKQRVTRLFRKCSRNTLDWCGLDRRAWRYWHQVLREKFEDNRHVTDPVKLEAILVKAEAELKKEMHPIPYVHPMAPGGSKWQRYDPYPDHVLEPPHPVWTEWIEDHDDWANGRGKYAKDAVPSTRKVDGAFIGAELGLIDRLLEKIDQGGSKHH